MRTTCSYCFTVFRIDLAQLRHRQGMVRCGVCSNAFQALEALIEEPSVPSSSPSSSFRKPDKDAPSPASRVPNPALSTLKSSADAISSAPQSKPSSLVNDANLSNAVHIPTASDRVIRGLTTVLEHVISIFSPYSKSRKKTGNRHLDSRKNAQSDDDEYRGNKILAMALVLDLMLALIYQNLMLIHDTPYHRLPALIRPLQSYSKTLCQVVGCLPSTKNSLSVARLEYYDLLEVPHYSEVKVLTFTLKNPSDLLVRLPTVILKFFNAQGEMVQQKTLTVDQYAPDLISKIQTATQEETDTTHHKVPTLSPYQDLERFVWLNLEKKEVNSFELQVAHTL